MTLSIWDSTFYNYLQAVHNLSITNTGYVANVRCLFPEPRILLRIF
jgi:hypothetical protein